MAMVKCPECGGNISSTTDRCIHCGFELTIEYKLENDLISEEEVAKKSQDIVDLLGNYKEAGLYDKAIALGKKLEKNKSITNYYKSQILNYMGLCYSNKIPSDYSNAHKSYKQAYQLNKKYLYLLNYMDVSLDWVCNGGSKSLCNEVITLGENVIRNENPGISDKGDIENYLGIAYQYIGDYDKAYKYYQLAKSHGTLIASTNMDNLIKKKPSLATPSTNSNTTVANNNVHCPYCGSTKVHKIGLGNKAASIGLFGIFAAGHVSKTWKCDNCGSKW